MFFSFHLKIISGSESCGLNFIRFCKDLYGLTVIYSGHIFDDCLIILGVLYFIRMHAMHIFMFLIYKLFFFMISVSKKLKD